MKQIMPLVFLAFIALYAPLGRAKDEAIPPVPALILKVEGDGIANVRKKSGIVESAGARGKVYVGDRIQTDARSVVHLLLNDGSILKIGFGSELRLAEVTPQERGLAWAFELTNGAIRVLAETFPPEGKAARLRVDTPSANVGVRGTEIVVAHDEEKNLSSVYVLEGIASVGALGCEKNSSCQELKTGEAASVSSKQKGVTKSPSFTMMELLAPLETDKRLPLYRSAKLIQAKAPFGSDEASLKKIVEENRADLAEGQDRAVGRTIKEREGMKKSVREGTFRSAMDAADAYTEARGVFAAKTNGGAENLVGPLIAAKFRLGDAVRGAASAGVFAANKSETDKEKWSSLGAAGFTYRKNVDYTQVETAKKWRAVVENALEEYRSTLEFAEALQSDSLTEKCDSTSCRMSRAVNEIEVVAEGVVAAYERVGPRPGNAPARLGTITTPYFSRIIPGNACFKKQETCSLKNCTGYANGKRCKAGELVNVCTARQVPIRCSKKAAN